MVVGRASGTLMASSLKENTFFTLKLHPAGSPPGTGGHGTGGHGWSPCDGVPRTPHGMTPQLGAPRWGVKRILVPKHPIAQEQG